MPNAKPIRFHDIALECFIIRIADWLRVMLFFLPLVAGFLYAVSGHAQQPATLGGKVVDIGGDGIANARVSLRSTTDHELAVVQTGASGEFRVVAPSGTAKAVASSSGFGDKTLAVSMESVSHDLLFELTPASVMQVLNVTTDNSDIAPQDDNTASRLNIPLISLPQSVSIVTNQVMLEQGVTKISEALRNVAGVSLANTYSGTYEYLSLRGFSQSQTASYFRDGVRFVMLSAPNIAAAEQIEVLKGPASILYGNVIPGGMINIISKKPQERFHNESIYRPGSFNSNEFFVDSTGPLLPKQQLFYRINVYGRKADSFRDYVYNNGYLLNPSLLWRPTAHTAVRVDLEYDRNFTNNDPGIPAPDGATVGSAAVIPRSRFYGIVDGPFRSLRRFYDMDVSQQISPNWIARGNYSYNNFMRDTHMIYSSAFNPATENLQQTYYGHDLFYKTTYGRGDITGTYHWRGITNSVVMGGDTLAIRSHYPNSLNISVPAINIYNPNYSRVLTWPYGNGNFYNDKQIQRGVYFQDHLSLPFGLSVLVGGRYTTLEQTSSGARTEANKFNPTVGVLYRPLNWLSLYGSYAESFEPVAGFDYFQSSFRPSLGKQVEAGAKTAFFNRRLMASVAWFDLRRTDVTTPDPNHTGFNIQSGEQGGRGAEIEVRGRIRSNWQIVSTYTHLNMRVLADNRYPIGNQLPQAPHHTASLWALHNFSGRLRPLTAGAGLFYTGAGWDSIANRFQLPAYTTVDANAGWSFEKHYRIQFNVKNLFDRRYYYGTNIVALYPGSPRAYQASIAATF